MIGRLKVVFCILAHNLRNQWRSGVVIITAAQLHSTKPELRFCAGSNPACGMSEMVTITERNLRVVFQFTVQKNDTLKLYNNSET